MRIGPRSIDFDSRRLDDLAPLLELDAHALVKLLGGAAGRRDALGTQPVLHVLLLKYLRHLAVEPLDHGTRQAAGADEAVPVDDLIARHARLRDRRHGG